MHSASLKPLPPMNGYFVLVDVNGNPVPTNLAPAPITPYVGSLSPAGGLVPEGVQIQRKTANFILDLEPLEGKVNSQMLAQLATVSIEMKDIVRTALDCYIDSKGNFSANFEQDFGFRVRGIYGHLRLSRLRHDDRYDDALLLGRFMAIAGWIYNSLYSHIAAGLGNVRPDAVILIDSYQSLDDAVHLQLSIDYLPF